MSTDGVARIGLILVALFVVGSVVSALVIRKIVIKLLTFGVLAVLALVVWTQRASIKDCADRTVEGRGTATCSFFGFDVDVDPAKVTE